MDAYSMVADMTTPPRIDWDEMRQRVLSADPGTQESVLQEELRAIHAENAQWMVRSDDIFDRTKRVVIFGQNSVFCLFMLSLVIGFALIFTGLAWAAVPVLAVPVIATVVLSFRLHHMRRDAIGANSFR